MSSGEEIFNRLQRQADEAKASRDAAASDRLMRWQNATLDVLPRYRKTAQMLANDCEDLMTRITFQRQKLTGVFKKRPIWEEGDHTAGWFILTRVHERYARGETLCDEFALFLLHDGQFLETEISFSRLIDAGILSKGQPSGGAITTYFYPEGPGILNKSAGLLDDLSITALYLRPSPERSSRFEAGFARLFHAAGRDMPSNLHLPEQ